MVYTAAARIEAKGEQVFIDLDRYESERYPGTVSAAKIAGIAGCNTMQAYAVKAFVESHLPVYKANYRDEHPQIGNRDPTFKEIANWLREINAELAKHPGPQL